MIRRLRTTLCVFAIVLGGCGGGTSGTGVVEGAQDASTLAGGSIRGVLVDEEGTPYSSTGVRREGSDFIILTDETGTFEVPLDGTEPPYVIHVSGTDIDTDVALDEAPEAGTELEITIDRESGMVVGITELETLPLGEGVVD